MTLTLYKKLSISNIAFIPAIKILQPMINLQNLETIQCNSSFDIYSSVCLSEYSLIRTNNSIPAPIVTNKIILNAVDIKEKINGIKPYSSLCLLVSNEMSYFSLLQVQLVNWVIPLHPPPCGSHKGNGSLHISMDTCLRSFMVAQKVKKIS